MKILFRPPWLSSFSPRCELWAGARGVRGAAAARGLRGGAAGRAQPGDGHVRVRGVGDGAPAAAVRHGAPQLPAGTEPHQTGQVHKLQPQPRGVYHTGEPDGLWNRTEVTDRRASR